MAQITINIPDAQLTRVINGFAGFHLYSATLGDGTANPQSKAAFAKDKLIESIKQAVANYEAKVAVDEARQAAFDSAHTGITLS
jgi:hypothetical protein